MNVLGIDSSTAASAACVLRSDGEAFEHEPPPGRLREPPGHARELMPAIAHCLDAAGLGWSDLDVVAVGVGPGTFTGLRVGVATARALASAHGAELRPVSSLGALAEGARAAAAALPDAGDGLGGTLPGPVLAAIDARRGELFVALYEGETPVWEPFAATPEAVGERLRGAGVAPPAVGDGAVRFRDVLADAGAQVPSDDSRVHVVRGLAVCRLARLAEPAPIEAVVPDYLRAPDATPQPR